MLVGKTSPPRFLEETGAGAFLQAQERRESSMPIRHGEKGWVDDVYAVSRLWRLVRCMVRSHKVPELEQFASRHGQKVSSGDWLTKKICHSLVMVLFTTYHQPTRYSFQNDCSTRSRNDRWKGRFSGRSRIDGTAFRGEKKEAFETAVTTDTPTMVVK